MACRYGHGHYENDSSAVSSRRLAEAYPLQTTGPRTAYEVKAVKEGLFGRVDMPGVGNYEVDVFVKDNTIFFQGEARTEYTDNPRTYIGSFDLSSHSDKIGEIRTEMKNGVFRFLAPKVFTQILPGQSSEGVPAKNKNPFQCKGPTWTYEEFVTNENKLFARIDMPGVEKESVKILVGGGSFVSVKGKAPKLWEYEEGCGRSYGGYFAMNCDCCQFVDNVEFSVENGVVQMLMPMIKIK